MLTLRRLGLWLALALALTACGGQGNSPSGSGSPGGEAGTRVVSGTVSGDVTVPSNPQRVVALWNTAAQVLELGVTPVGALSDEVDPEYLSPSLMERAKDTTPLGDVMELDYEKIIALKPDMIITMTAEGRPIDVGKLNEIAPTVAWKVSDPIDVWNLYPQIAGALGRTGQLDQIKQDLDSRMTKIKEEYADVATGKKGVIFQSYDPGVYEILTKNSLVDARMTGVGLSNLPLAEETSGEDPRIKEQALENLPALAGADVIFYEANPDGSPAGNTEELMKEAAFTQLPAAKKHLAMPLRQFSEYTYAAATLQLDDLEAALKKMKNG